MNYNQFKRFLFSPSGDIRQFDVLYHVKLMTI